MFTALTMGAFPAQLKPALDGPPIPRVTISVDKFLPAPPWRAYDDLIAEAAAKYSLDADLIHSVMQTESAFDPMAVSRAGAMGLMQLMPALAEEFGVTNAFDPRENIMTGARYLRALLDQHRGNLPLALASYNAGATNVRRYGGRIPPFPETQRYVKRITKLLARAQADD